MKTKNAYLTETAQSQGVGKFDKTCKFLFSPI